MKARHFAITAWILAGLIMAGTALAHQAGLMFNTTPSVPMGLWQVQPTTQKIHRGSMISICPVDKPIFRLARSRGYTPAGPCVGRYTPLLKRVAAIPGDMVTITQSGLGVNGKSLPNSRSQLRDAAGRPLPTLPPGKYQVASGTLWLISTHNANSFDSRYFGPLPAANVQGLARPIWIGGTR
jgi:conjugative transfer signal peptidase TraF